MNPFAMSPFVLGLVAAAAAAAVTTSPPLTPGLTTPQVATPGTAGNSSAGAPSAGAPSAAAQWPVLPATVVAGFEPHDRFGAGHRGVDLAASPGQPVRSALSGEVTFAGRVAGRSVVVVAHPGGIRTTYLPVVPAVAVGVQVSAGTIVGRLDADQHCAPSTCLHWGARRGDDYVDPLSLLARAGPIVLLPLR